MSITTPCANALSQLVWDARALSARAYLAGHHRLALAICAASVTLDAARTRLVEDGPDYLDAAWAFLDAGRRTIANYERLTDRAEIETHRARA